MKALPCEIYKAKKLGDCSNGGISSRYNEVLLLCEEGFIDVDMDNPPDNLCKVVTRDFGFAVYTHIEPVAKAKGVGWMAGGTLVYSSDSRFHRMCGDYALSLHDRTETQKEYDMYSV